jgi:hypothetical protein
LYESCVHLRDDIAAWGFDVRLGVACWPYCTYKYYSIELSEE